MRFNVYELTPTGGTHWVTSNAYGTGAEDALNKLGERKSWLLRNERTYLVIPNDVNGNGAQALFRWDVPKPAPRPPACAHIISLASAGL